MRTPPQLSPELEALLAPHRAVLPLAPSVEARAIARAAATGQWLPDSAMRISFVWPRWVFAAAAGVVLVMGAGAYAAWMGGSSAQAPALEPPGASSRAIEPQPSSAVSGEAPATMAPEAPARRRAVSKAAVAMLPPTNAELQLLRAARQDVTRGDFAGALVVIAEHARKFRHGSLLEEREALRVKSLMGLGRREEAQRAAAAFRARFPHSVFLPTFERMKEADR